MSDIEGLDSESSQIILNIDEATFEGDKKGIKTVFQFKSDSHGITHEDITQFDYYDILHRDDRIQRSIAFNYAQLRKPDGKVFSIKHMINNIVVDLEEIDNSIIDGDVQDLGDHLSNEDSDSKEGVLCIAMLLILNGSQ